MSELSGSSILVTGATGSFGKAFLDYALTHLDPHRIVVFSRDELKQYEVRQMFGDDKRLRFFLGDIRDRDRLARAMHGVDYLIHAAALKQVDTAEYNPSEYVATNINGSQNVIDAAIDAGVQKVVALSTDKASSPINLYGATKLVADKSFIAGNHYAATHPTRFSVVRYGNVMGSRGSVVPLFRKLAAEGRSLPITDKRMTRFWITLPQAVKFVVDSFDVMHGGELFVPRIPSMRIMDLVDAVAPDSPTHETGIRPGEKLHEEMIAADDSRRTLRFADRYVVQPVVASWGYQTPEGGEEVPDGFNYRSDNNDLWLSVDDMRKLIEDKVTVPYGRQSIDESDIEAVVATLTSDWLTTGPRVAAFEADIAAVAGAPAVTVTNGTTALHTAYAAAGVRPGDQVVTTPMTFVATASTAMLHGAEVLFADIEDDTANIDPAAVEALVTEKTRAIGAVDYAGHPAEYDALRKIAERVDALVIGDAAHAIGSTYHGRPVGTLADLTTFSFFPTKNLTTAEGGAVATTRPDLLERARDFRNIGMVRDPGRLRHPDEGGWYYEVHGFGLNYRLPDVLCALGSSQLRRLAAFKARRQQLTARYDELLSDLPGVRLPVQRDGVDPMRHLYPVRVLDGRRREVYDRLRAAGILVQVNYIPVYWHPLFADLGYARGMCPVAERFYAEELSLPLYYDLTDASQDRVVEALHDILGS